MGRVKLPLPFLSEPKGIACSIVMNAQDFPHKTSRTRTRDLACVCHPTSSIIPGDASVICFLVENTLSEEMVPRPSADAELAFTFRAPLEHFTVIIPEKLPNFNS